VLEDVLALLEELLLQLVDEGLKGVRAQLLEVDDVEQLILQPLLVLVLVLHQVVVQLLFDVGKDVQQLVEVILTHHPDCRVVLRLNRRRALRPSQQGDLTEVLSGIQCAYEALLAVLVLDEALALALGDNVEVVGGLALLDLDLLRLAHD